ncbi:MAG: hypothetical protein U1F11_05360 [Steroidobacteraceae bacterium]
MIRNPCPLFAALAAGALVVAAALAPTMTRADARGPDVPACRSVPLAPLSAALGASAKPLIGTDRQGFQSCTFAAGPAASAKIERQTPGQPGLPPNVKVALMLARQTVGSGAKDFESQDLGKVGCYRMVLSMRSMPATYSTACFDPAGYTVLTLSRQGQAVPMQAVADLLRASAAH